MKYIKLLIISLSISLQFFTYSFANEHVLRSTPDSETQLNVRKKQVHAAVKALKLDGYMLEPIFAVFPSELMKNFALGSPFGFNSLWVSTRAEGEDASHRLKRMLKEVYECSEETANLAMKLAKHFEHKGIWVAVEEARGKAEPTIRFGFAGEYKGMDILLLMMKDLGVDRTALKGYSNIKGSLMLTNEDITSFSVVLDQPHSPPRIDVTIPLRFSGSEITRWQGQLDQAHDDINIPKKQKDWSKVMLEALAPRVLNEVPVTISLTKHQLVNQLRLQYSNIPMKNVLTLMSQFSPAKDNEQILKKLFDNVGKKDRYVNKVFITTRDKAPPQLKIEVMAK